MITRRTVLAMGIGLGAAPLLSARGALPMEVTAEVWKDVKRAQGIEVASVGHQAVAMSSSFFVFFDPNCPFCARLWQTAIPTHLGGTMAGFPATWIPVSYLKPTSWSRSVAILRSGRPQALERNFRGFDEVAHEGAIEPIEEGRLSEQLIMERNNRIWTSVVKATPLLVWDMKSAGRPARWIGSPAQEKLATFVSDVRVGPSLDLKAD